MKKAAFFLIMALLGVVFAPSVFAATNDAVAGYTFDNADLSAGLPDDVTGNGNDATANSADTGATGIVNQGFDYESTNSDSTTYTDLDLTPPFAISLWWKPESTGIVQGIITKRDGTNNDNFLNYRLIAHDTDTFRFYAANTVSGAYCSLTSTTTFSAGTWYNVIVNVPASGNCEIYVNGGTAEATSAVSGTIYTHNSAFYTGKNTPTAGYADGVLDELYMYNHVLSAGDIAELYNSGSGFQPYATGASNATATAQDSYTSASLTNFTLTFNGNNYTTTNGTVVLPVLTNTTSLWNLTYYSTEAGGYFSRAYSDINLSSSHTGSLHQAEVTFYAQNRVSSASVDTFSANTSSNGGSTSDTATNPQLNVTAAENYTAEFNKNGYYAAFTTFNASALSTSNATFSVYDHKLNITINILGGSATDQNFTVDVYGRDSLAGFYEQASTTNGYIEFNLTDGNYTVWLNDSIHELTSANLTLNTSVNLTAYQFDVYTTNAVTFRFYTEEDPELLDFRNVTAFLTGDIVSYNFTTDNGTYYIDLIEPQPYVVTFFADDFAQRQWHFTLTNRTSEEIDLFLINDSDDSIIEANVVQTLLDTVVNNATVRLARKNLSGTNYYNVESCVTAVDGSCLLHAQIQDPTYRLTVLYEGTTRLISEDFQFSSTAASNGITIPIQLASSTLQTWRELGDVSYTYTNTTPTNDTVQFTFSWSDNEGNVQSGCLKVTQRTLSSWSTAYNSCTSGTTGTETYTLNTTNIDEYDSLAYFTYSGGQYDVTASGENVDDPLSRGGGAVLFSIALVLLVTVIAYGLSQGSAAGLITPVLVGASLLLMYWFGIFTITRGAIVTLVLLAAVVVWITARRNA